MIAEINACDLKIMKIIVEKIIDHLIRKRRRCDHHKRPVSFFDLCRVKNPLFVQQPRKKRDEQVHDHHDTCEFSRDQRTLVDHKQKQDVQQHKADLKPESGDKFLDPGSSEYIFVAVCKKYYEHLAQCQKDRLISVKICAVRIFQSYPYPIAQNEADLEHNDIENDKIDVLKPAPQFFFMHNTLPAATKKYAAIRRRGTDLMSGRTAFVPPQ